MDAQLIHELTAPESLAEDRRRALEQFASQGLPTPRLENWRYTSLRHLTKTAFSRDAGDRSDLSGLEELGLLEAHRLVFVNGRFSAELSELGKLPKGATVGPLSDQDGSKPAQSISEHADEALLNLNTALAEDGLHLHLAEKVALELPVHCLFIVTNPDQARLVQLRNVIHLAPQASCHWVEHYLSIDDPAHFINVVNDVSLEEGARLDQTRIQGMEQRQTLVTRQASVHHENADLHYYGFDFGAQLARHDLNASLEGEHSSANFHGVYVGRGKRHIDNHLRVDHKSPNATSAEHFKGVLQDRSRGVFNGKAVVHAGADGTDASQSNHNLLMSAHAEIDTKPELEIYADDVKCSHGATVGQLDEKHLFYLKSRGIAETDARAMLVRAFCGEVLDQLSQPELTAYLELQLTRQLPQMENSL